MKDIEKIQAVFPEIAESARLKCGFLCDEQIEQMSGNDSTRLIHVLVRCGNGRFVCSAQDVKHFINIIENSKQDYVRDISLPL